MNEFLKPFGVLLTILFFGNPVIAQRPDIKSVDKVSGSMDELVTIQGHILEPMRLKWL